MGRKNKHTEKRIFYVFVLNGLISCCIELVRPPAFNMNIKTNIDKNIPEATEFKNSRIGHS